MNTLVVDASVAAKWNLPDYAETLVIEANRLLADYLADRVRLLVPDLFWTELANFLRKAVRRATISESEAQSALKDMRERDLPTVPSGALIEEALSIALQFDCSVYDSIYVALAISAHAELVTADERLANALAARFPVKWLGIF